MTISHHSCPTVLLDDAPSNSDAFSSESIVGPHKRTAAAIAELIESTDGGKAIGLEGEWGAGKSTVVKLLISELSKSQKKEIKTIIFDAWSHEGDPLRRSFLETTVNSLISAGWIRKDEWKQRLEGVAKRRKKTTSKTTSNPTVLGVLLALSLLFVPFGATLLQAGIEKPVYFFVWSYDFNFRLLLGLLTIAPLLVLLGNAIKLKVNKSSVFSLDNWAFVTSNTTTDMTTEEIETPEPTSIEFESYFAEAMNEALSKGEKRGVLVVVDNLDRVDEGFAKQIWATLQTFVHPRSTSDGWRSGLWVLVPYAPNGLKKLWKPESAEAINHSSNNDENVTKRDASQSQLKDCICESFLEKSFQVRFSVAPTVLSDWRAYITELLLEAFPSHNGDEAHAVYRVYESFRGERWKQPTPRQLKSFINQIGALHRQWGDTFPIDHLAYFTIECKDRGTFIKALTDSSIPTKRANILLGNTLKQNLAALAFNSDPDKSLELLLSQPIMASALEGDGSELLSLHAKHGDNFWLVVEKLFSDVAFDSDQLATIAVSFDNAHVFGVGHGTSESRAKRAFVSQLRSLDAWHVVDENTPRDLEAVFKINCDKKIISHIIDLLREAALQSAVEEEGEVIKRVTGIIQSLMLPAVRDANLQLNQPFKIVAAGNSIWPTCCSMIVKLDPAGTFWSLFRPNVQSKEFAAHLTSTLIAGGFDQKCYDAIQVSLADKPEPLLWAGLITAAAARLHANNGIPDEELSYVVRALILPRFTGHPAKRIHSNPEVENERQESSEGQGNAQKIYTGV